MDMNNLIFRMLFEKPLQPLAIPPTPRNKTGNMIYLPAHGQNFLIIIRLKITMY